MPIWTLIISQVGQDKNLCKIQLLLLARYTQEYY